MKCAKTLDLETRLMKMTVFNRTYGCPEVTIGWYGRKRVDFMETNTRGLIKCYEVKVSRSDFLSKHGHNFVGNYNYYVMTRELYDNVKDLIPDGIGVMVPAGSALAVQRKAKYRSIDDGSKMIMYLLRSMSREVKKSFGSKDEATLAYWKREASRAKRELRESKNEKIRSRRKK